MHNDYFENQIESNIFKNNNSSDNLAVIVVSCDLYSDVWKPFFTLFFKYWNDCPFCLYLTSNFLQYPDSRVKTINLENDENWSSSLKKALKKINENYVMIILEDFLITHYVDTRQIKELWQYMLEKNAACLRLFPCPGPDKSCKDNPNVGLIVKGAPYRSSTMVAIWDKEILLTLLQNGETAWEFELKGTKRTNNLDRPFLSVINSNDPPIQYICSAIIRGKWIPELPAFFKKEGIHIDFSQRGFWKWYTNYVYRLNMWVQNRIKNLKNIKDLFLKQI